jgi:hypothetical protein
MQTLREKKKEKKKEKKNEVTTDQNGKSNTNGRMIIGS